MNKPSAIDDCARTWRVATSTAQRINDLASKLECFPSELVDMLLQRALFSIESGQWVIHRRPYKYTLHWSEHKTSGNEAGMKRY